MLPTRTSLARRLVVIAITFAIHACAFAAAPPTARDAEIVPTARRADVTWRYTFERPASDDWRSVKFDDAGWRTGSAPFGTDGTPNLQQRTRWTTADIWLRREIELPGKRIDLSTVQLIVFHDEDVEIYLDGVLAARARGFNIDYEPLDIRPEAKALIKPGAKLVLAVHCHQNNGGQGIDVGLAEVSQEFIANRRRNSYRNFAMSNPGNATAGKAIFSDEKRLACTKCHTVDGSAAHAGPDLATIGDKYPRAELIHHVLNPSAGVAVGYETTIVTTKSGDVLMGVVKEASDDSLGLMDGSGKLQHVALSDLRARRTQNASLMPTDLETGLSQPEFADLIEYLVSLHLPGVADAGRAGMPANIPELRTAVTLVPIHSTGNKFENPCWMGELPQQTGVFLVCEHQTGKVWRLSTGAGESKTLWGDFRKEIRPGGATGLLGLAFHPHFRENRKYYIQHQVAVGNRIVARVSEKTASPDFTRDSGEPSRTIIEFPCSTDVHSGGGIQFGPDGFLYIGMGDTGPQGDPQGRGQDLRSPLGKMLRIDVDRTEGENAYAIPADNPFIGRSDARPEIYAYGFREPWRFSFDRATHDLWVGDVGQDRIEEIDLVHKGDNYGWNVYEGFDLFSTKYRTEGRTLVPPVFAYNRRLGNSITGGYVYRGEPNSPFNGLYICADFTSKRVWGLKQSEGKLQKIWQLATSPEEVSSFAEDEAGALYLVGYQGTLFKLQFPSDLR